MNKEVVQALRDRLAGTGADTVHWCTQCSSWLESGVVRVLPDSTEMHATPGPHDPAGSGLCGPVLSMGAIHHACECGWVGDHAGTITDPGGVLRHYCPGDVTVRQGRVPADDNGKVVS